MIYAAKYLLKPEGGHIEDAAVRVSGIRIDAVGTLQEMRMRYPEDRIEDFGMAVLAPGFVDAHTHLEYSTMNGIFEDAPYAAWKASIVEKGRLMTPEDWDDSALFGAMAYKYYRKNLGLAVWPLLMMSALFILVPSLQSQTSILIIPSGALAILLAWLKYRKDKKQ